MKTITGTITVALALALTLGTLTACSQNKKKNNKRVKPTSATIETTVETTDGPTGGSNEKGSLEDWNIWERKVDKMKVLQIQNSGFHGRETENDYLLFWVFESESDAQKYYKKLYKEFKDYDRGNWEEGDNWFISDEPGVCDASIIWMNYLSGNIIISADLSIRGCEELPEDYTFETTEPAAPVFDRAVLKDYILNNVPEIIRFVNEDLLVNLPADEDQ